VVELSVDVAADQAQATYDDGILRVELPIRLPQGARQVPIERSEG
jgi:HSP20 family protein